MCSIHNTIDAEQDKNLATSLVEIGSRPLLASTLV